MGDKPPGWTRTDVERTLRTTVKIHLESMLAKYLEPFGGMDDAKAKDARIVAATLHENVMGELELEVTLERKVDHNGKVGP